MAIPEWLSIIIGIAVFVTLYMGVMMVGFGAIGIVPILIVKLLDILGYDVGKPPPMKHAFGYGLFIALACFFVWAFFSEPSAFLLGGGRAGDLLYADE